VRSVAHWAHTSGQAGAEVDLEKAFDGIEHEMVSTAMRCLGTPEVIVRSLGAAWRAPRYCHVNGEIAAALHPNCGIPAGDPNGTRALAAVLVPWHVAVPKLCPGVSTWAYVDDRSLKAVEAPDGTQARDSIQAALELTSRIDSAIGCKENVKKRQVWEAEQTAEHLGVRAAANSSLARPPLPKPRDGWQAIADSTKALATIPGGRENREKLCAIAVVSKYRWAAPFVERPPKSLVEDTFRALIDSKCTWWDKGRFWAERLHLHPIVGTALQAIKSAETVCQWPSALLGSAVAEHAAVFGMKLADPETSSLQNGIWLTPVDEQSMDPRAREAFRACAVDGQPGQRKVFLASSPKGLHALRVIARAQLLGSTKKTRNDSEGIEGIDIEAMSCQRWKRWKEDMPADERRRLTVWRAGAVKTPTRNQTEMDHKCPWCGADYASMRHFFVDCEHFDQFRADLQLAYSIPANWWALQPRVTSKTGWITLGADASAARRTKLQVPVAKLGVYIMEQLEPFVSRGNARRR
jgi:hypothetical protein